MKRIATIKSPTGQVVGLVRGPDASSRSIVVNGRTWRFDFDRYGGPHWMRADGYTPRQCQCPTSKAVWEAFTRWHKQFTKEASK